jgi:hypothetical protein
VAAVGLLWREHLRQDKRNEATLDELTTTLRELTDALRDSVGVTTERRRRDQPVRNERRG